MLNINDYAPEIELPDQNGTIHKLADLKGKWVFIYFYPKDDTPGCTTEACDLRDNYEAITKLGVEVFGISPDSVKKHKKFEQKNELNFTILSDEEKKVVTAYDVWKEKKFWGKAYMGVERTSFLVDPNGKIAKVWEKVNPKGHVAEVLAVIPELLGDPQK